MPERAYKMPPLVYNGLLVRLPAAFIHDVGGVEVPDALDAVRAVI